MNRRLLFPVLLVASSLLLLSGITEAASNNCQRFTTAFGNLQISVEVNGTEVPAVLTTSNIGASISNSLARDMRLTQRVDPDLRVVTDTGRDQEYLYSPNVPITLFGFETTAERVAITNSDDRYITLSLRLFDNLIIQIDFPNSRMCFISREALDLRQEQNIELDSGARFGTPTIRVTLNNDFETWLDFSPSFGGGLRVDEFTARSLELEPTESNQNPASPFLSSTLNTLTFGPYELGGIPVQYPKDGVRSNLTRRQETLTNTNIQADRQTRGRIGMEVLKHFIVTMDFEAERMHVFAP